MRRPLIGLAVAIGFSALAPGASAQLINGAGGGFATNPFSLYYGFYLPRQQLLANQTTSQDLINNQMVARQQSVIASERPGLFEDTPAFAIGELDPSQSFGRQRSGTRSYQNRRPASFQNARSGGGPPGYFGTGGSTPLAHYHPTLPQGHGPNRNIARTRGAVGRASSASSVSSGLTNTSPSNYGGFQ